MVKAFRPLKRVSISMSKLSPSVALLPLQTVFLAGQDNHSNSPIRASRWLSGDFAISFILVFFFLHFLSGCQWFKKVNPEQKKVAEAVYLYNDTLIEAYSKENPYLLQGIATEEEVNRVLKHLVFITAGGEQMAYELKRLDFKKFGIKETSATVNTEEVWRYRVIDKKTGKQKGKPKTLEYKVTYKLIKQKGKWFVANIEARER